MIGEFLEFWVISFGFTFFDFQALKPWHSLHLWTERYMTKPGGATFSCMRPTRRTTGLPAPSFSSYRLAVTRPLLPNLIIQVIPLLIVSFINIHVQFLYFLSLLIIIILTIITIMILVTLILPLSISDVLLVIKMLSKCLIHAVFVLVN